MHVRRGLKMPEQRTLGSDQETPDDLLQSADSRAVSSPLLRTVFTQLLIDPVWMSSSTITGSMFNSMVSTSSQSNLWNVSISCAMAGNTCVGSDYAECMSYGCD